MELTGRVALITGGTRMGAVVGTELARDGADIALDRDVLWRWPVPATPVSPITRRVRAASSVRRRTTSGCAAVAAFCSPTSLRTS